MPLGIALPIISTIAGAVISGIAGKGKKPPSWEDIQRHGITLQMFTDAGLDMNQVTTMLRNAGVDPSTITTHGIDPQTIASAGITKEWVDQAGQGLSAGALRSEFGPEAVARDTTSAYNTITGSPEFGQQLAQAGASGNQLQSRLRAALGMATGGDASTGVGSIAGALGAGYAGTLRGGLQAGAWTPAAQMAEQNAAMRLQPYAENILSGRQLAGQGMMNTQDWLGRTAFANQEDQRAADELRARLGMHFQDTLAGQASDLRGELGAGRRQSQDLWGGFQRDQLNRPNIGQQIGGALLGAGSSALANYMNPGSRGGGSFPMSRVGGQTSGYGAVPSDYGSRFSRRSPPGTYY